MRRFARCVGFLLVSSLLAFPGPVPAQVCGDGVVSDGETCDPPGSPAGAGICRADCTFCGDGIINDDETCDVGAIGMCGACTNRCSYQILEGGGDGGCPCSFDDPDLAALRTDILATCECSTASSHGAFVRCARGQLDLSASDRILPGCPKIALKCLARSVCGKPAAVTCCRTNARGVQTCSIKSDAGHCTAPKGGSAVLGTREDCCDACP